MEKARSLLEAEGTLDELDERFQEANLQEANLQASLAPEELAGDVPRTGAEQRGSGHPSGFVPASASQSGFSPVGGRGAASGLPGRASNPDSGAFMASGSLSGGRLVDSLQGALGAASRNEAGLGSLQRAIRDASRAFTASRQAQEALTEELRVMHRGLNELMSEKAGIERYAALLTQERDAALDAAEEARREAKREREFLLREQDRFIQLLLEEHEAELQQLRRTLNQRPPGEGASGAVPGTSGSLVAAVATLVPLASPQESAPITVPGVPAAGIPTSSPAVGSAAVGTAAATSGSGEAASEGRKSVPPGEFSSGAAIARQALANAAGSEAPVRAVPLPPEGAAVDNRSVDNRTGDNRSVDNGRVDEEMERLTYPPAPTVLDLDSLAAEVDGNSERPPPIRRIGVAEPKIHLKPARVPTQLFDTLVSPVGEIDPDRKL